MNKLLYPPPFLQRVYSVWYRHILVYVKNIFSNGLPPFLEPLLFLLGVGLGLGGFVGEINGIHYVNFLAAGIIAPPAMFTAAYECTFGTFIRLEFDKVYDGMISASITVNDLFIGEILFAGTKGLFFSSAVLAVLSLFGLIESPMAFFNIFVGFFTGVMFAVLSLLVTSFVNNINHFNFYFTGFITPAFFLSGIVFPLDTLPRYVEIFAHIFPLMHSVNLMRAFCFNNFEISLLGDVFYIIIFILTIGFFAIKRLKQKIIT
jgi:lipooligosaccharide transport system permease protein